jgi:uncharacterized DUF497 family protein
LELEWDTRKAARNVAKHGVPFEYATRAFLDPHRLDIDYRRDYGEQRRFTLGRIDGRVFAVAYTPRIGVIRVISARRANERERKQYDQTLPT